MPDEVVYKPLVGWEPPPPPLIVLDPDREGAAWVHGYRGSMTVWIEYAPDYIRMYVPGFKPGDRIEWPGFPVNVERIGELLTETECSRVTWEAGVYDDGPRELEPRSITGVVVGIGHVYTRDLEVPGERALIWRQWNAGISEGFTDEKGNRWGPVGMLVELDDASGEVTGQAH